MTPSPVVALSGITKRFPGIVANDAIDLEVYAGEIHALLGENGAGKTTLMKILYGLYRPDAGHICIDGQAVMLRSPQDAIRLGLGMAFQQFSLIPSLTVAENIALAVPSSGLRLRLADIAVRLGTLSQRYGLPIDPWTPVWRLSVGEQQRVELLKLLYRQARILILDEPTSVLTPLEARGFLRAIQAMAASGLAVILISHKMDEVLAVAHRITVLRRGRAVVTVPRREATAADLARAMIGRDLRPPPTRPLSAPGEVVLSVRDVSVREQPWQPALHGISFDLRQGEILGIAGVAGNGQRELAEVLVGLRRVTAGSKSLQGRDVTHATPREMIRLGVGYIPEDRLGSGLIPQASILDNLLLKAYQHPPFAYGPFLRYRVACAQASRLLSAFQVTAPSLHTLVGTLSGGNQQRLLLAREFSTQPILLIAAHPTRGLDAGAIEHVQHALLEQRQRGCAILLISEDLEELVALCDRIAVMYAGTISGIVSAAGADPATLGALMTGDRALCRNSLAEMPW